MNTSSPFFPYYSLFCVLLIIAESRPCQVYIWLKMVVYLYIYSSKHKRSVTIIKYILEKNLSRTYYRIQHKTLYFSSIHARPRSLVHRTLLLALERLMEFWDRRATMNRVTMSEYDVTAPHQAPNTSL